MVYRNEQLLEPRPPVKRELRNSFRRRGDSSAVLSPAEGAPFISRPDRDGFSVILSGAVSAQPKGA
jgi:hypothetical protein